MIRLSQKKFCSILPNTIQPLTHKKQNTKYYFTDTIFIIMHLQLQYCPNIHQQTFLLFQTKLDFLASTLIVLLPFLSLYPIANDETNHTLNNANCTTFFMIFFSLNNNCE